VRGWGEDPYSLDDRLYDLHRWDRLQSFAEARAEAEAEAQIEAEARIEAEAQIEAESRANRGDRVKKGAMILILGIALLMMLR